MAARFSQALGNFKVPKEIRNDIIYCQRALLCHLKVHQMIVDQYPKDKEYSTTKLTCLKEIESEIYEINCEQQYLLLRVRRIIDEFFKSLHREDVSVDRGLMNDYISRHVVPFIQNKNFICVPNLVRVRFTESQLIETYLLSNNKSSTPPIVKVEIPQPPPEPPMPATFSAKQVSLLKPISERVVKVEPSRTKRMPEVVVSKEEKPATPVDLPVSSKVKISRMNLRQALNKAAAAIHVPSPQPAPVAVVAAPKPAKIVTETVKKSHPKAAKSEPSSSEESNDARMPSPPKLDLKTTPDDYNQEAFLSVFSLYTQEQIQQMQKRRSKRKRRGAHNNEKSDFHYGRIDLSSPLPIPKKRKKEFLLSPRVNRALKKKRSIDADRSNSSSPDEKTACNECLLPTGTLIQCKECLGTYHEDCHKDMNIKTIPGQCPSCSRMHYNAKLQQEADKKKDTLSLRGQCRDLEMKLAMESHRREKLQKESTLYKIGMTKLFTIVETIKSDGNDS